jgi:hypothetical protein
MGASASGAAAFYREVAEKGEVWAIQDAEGFPTATNASGETAMPFWSSRSRTQLIIRRVEAYSGFEPVQLSLEAFLQHWLPGLQNDGLFVGVNWSGERAKGYDVQPQDVAKSIAHHLRAGKQAPR